ncbi:hypothetical protein CAPTEDRAFT_120045 [Capitella teleta]|uniref:Potassium channel domain-containing protein n=1 Tax=Capitella teleta TaxID=283909 RepID=R7TB53_CAPTE|nr:hypothetical protein CAPTEDRAFT_120045 [Capitella teleta]|eukprot:ELT90934.1 hypothetical protein CAPTEDRAFT_120045 [Capitella teleta]
MKKQNVRTLSLIVCTFTYLLVGAAVFDSLESQYETQEKEKLESEEKEFRAKYNITGQDYSRITLNVLRSVPHKAGIQWKFSGAFYFATTVITTIGYGHSAPKTIGGKMFCMCYALAGIPLNLVMFQSIGERLNIFVTYLLRNIKKCFKFKDLEVSQTNLIVVCMVMSNIVVAGGAGAFSFYEEWNYIDSFYYCVITLTTIGFGDYVALQRNGDLQHKPEYVAFSLIFILFGLTVVSAAMNLLVLRFLTMNTDDERKDELEAATAARTAVRLEGDVITANGSIISGQQEGFTQEYSDLTSVCSCTCYNLQARGSKHRYSVTRSPGKIAHLLPMHQILNSSNSRNAAVGSETTPNDDMDEDTNSLLRYQLLRQKRNSI